MKILNKQSEKELDVLTVEVGFETYQTELKKRLQAASLEVKVSGFRKGKAPYQKAIEAVDKQKVMQATLNKLAKQVADWLDETSCEVTAKIVGNPVKSELADFDEGAKVCTFKLWYETLPSVELADYSKIIATQPFDKKVTEQAVDEAISLQLNQAAMLITKDQGASANDVVDFDFAGFLNGEALENAKAEHYELDLANSNFIPGYADNLIGLKAGEEKTFTIKFPTNYQVEKLCDQEVVFKVKIHAVKTKQVPQLNDEFVQSLGDKNITNVNQFKSKIEVQISEKFNQENQQTIMNAIYSWAIGNETNKLSHFPTNDVRNNFLETYEERKKSLNEMFKSMGGYKGYLKAINQTDEVFKQSILNEILNNIKLSTVLSEIAKRENISVDAAEIELVKTTMATQLQQLAKSNDELNNEAASEVALQKKVLEFLKSRIVYEPISKQPQVNENSNDLNKKQ